MSHATTRAALVAATLLSGGISLRAIAPSVARWNASTQELQEAANRAQTCDPVDKTIGSKTQVVLADSNAAPADGVSICDWAGMTAEVGSGGQAVNLRKGRAEEISTILKERGFHP